jgi:DNA-binding CsgD family transcriptional regulator
MDARTGSEPVSHRAEPFVGRVRELALLRDAVAQAVAGNPRVVLIEAGPGYGKTTLVRQALAATDLTVVQASGEESEASVPFAMLDQLERRMRCEVDDGELRAPLSTLALPDAIAGGARLITLLGLLQAEGAVALVVDDLHWCDTASLHALVFALRRLGADRVVAVLVSRRGPGYDVPRALRELVASEQGVSVRLGGLGREEIRELASTLGLGFLPRRALTHLTAHTRGNPLYARALLQELDPHTLIARAGTPLPAPRTFASLVMARIHGCAPETRRLVDAAAVLGNRCSSAEASVLAELDEDVSARLLEASAGQLLRVFDAELGRQLVFSHPLVRASIYHGLDPERRRALHERAASSTDDVRVRLSHRVAATTGADDDLADELAAFATSELRAGLVAAPAAADALQAAARVAGSLRQRQAYLVGAAECLIAAGELGTATHVMATLDDAVPTPALRYVQGALALHTGSSAEARRLLEAAWESATREEDLAAAAGAAAQLAIFHLRWANADEVTGWARRSLDAGGPRLPLGPGPGMALALGLAAGGRYRESAEAIPPLPEPSDEVELADLEWLLARGIARLWSDDPVGARRDLSGAVEVTRRFGLVIPRLFALYHVADAEFRLGAWDDAVAHGELAVSMAEDCDQFGMLASVHGNAALPLACRGDLDAADAHVRHALAACAVLPDATNVTWARSAQAGVAAARGDHEAVVSAVQAIGSTLRSGGDEPAIKPWRVLGAEAFAALSEPDRADELLRPFERRAEAGGLRLSRAIGARARGVVELARGRPESAERHLKEALLGTTVAPFERAQVELVYGSLLRRQGRRRDAHALLDAAQRTFVALGAAPYAERTHRELVGCGLTPARRTPEARYQLTPQEQTVVHFVTEGLSNLELAAELVVSVKTIEYHLGNVYRKLQVPSRTRLLALLASEQRQVRPVPAAVKEREASPVDPAGVTGSR